MTNLSHNNPSTDFYDNFWRNTKDKLNFAEIFRIHFITENIKKFTNASNLKILDYGCGRGWMAPFLSKYGSVTGIDFGPAGIELAKKKYGDLADFHLIDTKNQEHQFSLLENKFDVVVCSEVVEHINDQLSFLKNLSNFLKPEGLCILTTPNGLFWPDYKARTQALSRIFKNTTFLQPTENWLTPTELQNLFQKTNFKILNHQGIISYKIGMPPMGGLIRFEWYLYNLFKKENPNKTELDKSLSRSLYQCIVCKKI